MFIIHIHITYNNIQILQQVEISCDDDPSYFVTRANF
jgi:hypothetical protein